MIDISILKRKNFQPEEFIASGTAERECIDNNIYCPNVLANLSRVADKMQEIRSLLSQPIVITSGYRCLTLNRAIKRSKDTSQHIKGQAVDFYCPRFQNNSLIVKKLQEHGIVVDQCLMEGSWMHLSIVEYGKNRNLFANYLPDTENNRKLKKL